jgi:1,4-alpha-glucan branching enzyme
LPNEYGGNENLEAIAFMRQLNRSLYHHHPDIHVIAEESTAWPDVTQPTDAGGLGFGLKWDMGWMHDTLEYMSREPIHRRHHHREVTFRSNWAFSEKFVLPLSHDEVVHGKGSIFGRMPGDDWQRHANLRALFGWQWAQPGKKLLFMGSEIAMPGEWTHEDDLPVAAGDPRRPAEADHIAAWVTALNDLYRRFPAMHRGDTDWDGFRWLIGNDDDNSVCAFLRLDPVGEGDPVLVVANFTPVVRDQYQVGVPCGGEWTEIVNGDDLRFGGSGVVNGPVIAHDEPLHGQPHRVALRIPPLSVVFLSPTPTTRLVEPGGSS